MLTTLRRLKNLIRPAVESPVSTPKEAKWYVKELDHGVRKASHIQTAVLMTSELDGMVVECGVATAWTLSVFTHSLRRSGDSRRILGIDSFEGFPPGSEHDNPQFSPDRTHAHYRLFTKDFAYENLLRSGLSRPEADSVELVKGWIPEVFSAFDGPISILHIDVDLYEPYRDSLGVLWPRVQRGGVVLFDEYDQAKDQEKWPGAQKAVDEFCASEGLAVKKHWSGFAYLVK